MSRKLDVVTEKIHSWDEYRSRTPDEALKSIFDYAHMTAKTITTWYWVSIKTKRRTSQALRLLAFVLLVIGTGLPIVAAMREGVGERLACTQLGVAALALTGLLQLADRIFGWSSGWLRYITTVTAMEAAMRKFELEWSGYLLGKASALTEVDVKVLFDLARSLTGDLLKLQGDETDKWVSEFNSGTALLDNMIKSQRESTERAMEVARAAVSAQEDAAQAKEAAERPGAIEVILTAKSGVVPVQIALDDEPAEPFLGLVWSRLNVSPGQHLVRVVVEGSAPMQSNRVAAVPAGGTACVEVKLPQ